MNNKKYTQIKLNKTIYITFIIVVLFYSNSFCDIGSISPTIDDHINPDQWQEAGYPGRITSDNPTVVNTIDVDNPTGDPGNDFDAINQHLNYGNAVYGVLTQITLQSGIYALNQTLILPENVTLAGVYQFKKDKDLEDRTILEFDLGDNELNCIELIGTESNILENLGVEDLYIKRIDSGSLPSGEHGHNIVIQNCENCWVSGVESYRPVKHHIDIKNSNHIEVRGCYFHDAQHYGVGGAGYGVACDGSCNCLIEDNIFEHLRHSMIVFNESNYNVFGYNYSTDAYQSNIDEILWGHLPSNFSGDMVCHGHPTDESYGPGGNLFEGNKGQFIWVDHFHGLNGPNNTFHRNSANKYGYWIGLSQQTQNIVNNHLRCGNRWLCLLGFPRGRLLACPYLESYSKINYRDIWGIMRSTIIERNLALALYDGIFNYYETWDCDESYYYEEKPDFLPTSCWPFDPQYYKNPSTKRYEAGYKNTKSRYEPEDVFAVYYLDEDVVFPGNVPDIPEEWLYYNYGSNNKDFIRIPPGALLIIDEGVTLSFGVNASLRIFGSLIAKGTDPEEGGEIILFTSIDTGERWEGIYIGNSTGSITGTQKFEFCKFENTDVFDATQWGEMAGAISVIITSYRDEPDIIIRNCVFENNKGYKGGAIYIESINDGLTPEPEVIYGIIEDCEFYNNVADYGGAIFLAYAKATIRNNLIYDNYGNNDNLRGGGIYIFWTDEIYPVDIISNLICDNEAWIAGGIYMAVNTQTKLINNTIANNIAEYAGGLYLWFHDDYYDNEFSYIPFVDNIIWENEAWGSDPQFIGSGNQIYMDIDNQWQDNYQFDFYNCDIEGGIENYNNPDVNNIIVADYDTNEPINLVGEISGNINSNPLFTNPNIVDYSLECGSSCINAGLTEDEFLAIEYLTIDDWYNLPDKDLAQNKRIATGIIDMGAYEDFFPGIYIPDNEIDFEYADLDEKVNKELVIENQGDIVIDNIEIIIPESITDYYTIDPDNIPNSISPGESVSIPIEFCCHKMFVHCEDMLTITSSDPYVLEIYRLICGAPALDKIWNWISFPELERDENGEQDAEEVLESLEPYAIQVLSQNGDMVYNPYTKDTWTHNNIYDFNSTDGYKLLMSSECEFYPFSMIGDEVTVIPPDTEIDLNQGYNWIGYWLPESQDIDVAFGDYWDNVISIQAENWYYHIPPENPGKDGLRQIKPVPSCRIRPLHYGRCYIVKVDTDIPNFHWYNSGEKASEFNKKETQFFSYEEKADYEVIDVIDIDESIIEIGIFEDGECKGAVLADSSGEQILVYSDSLNKDYNELSFQIVTGRGKITLIKNYSVYDEKTGIFVESQLIAGKQEYSLVRLNTGENILPAEFCLSQNYPNPFSGSTVISFSTTKNAKNTKIKIYNIKGQLVKILECGESPSAKAIPIKSGLYSISWDGKDDNGKLLGNGIYFYKLTSGDKSAVKKMVLMR